MKFEHMSGSEVLRLAEPETDLEHKLLSIVEEYRGQIDSLQDEVRSCGPQECESCDGFINQIEELEIDLEDKEKEVNELNDLLDTATTP